MALPITPLLGLAVRYGPIVATLAAAAAYNYARERYVDQRGEDLMDELGEGLDLTKTPDGTQMNARGRMRRKISIPGKGSYDLDASFLGRISLRPSA